MPPPNIETFNFELISRMNRARIVSTGGEGEDLDNKDKRHEELKMVTVFLRTSNTS